MKKLLRLLPFLLVMGCGKSGPAPEAPKIQDVPVQVEATGEVDPIAAPEAVTGGSFTTWGGGYPKSLNVWLDNNSFSGTISGLMFEPLVDLHSTEDRAGGRAGGFVGSLAGQEGLYLQDQPGGEVERRAAGHGGGHAVLLRCHHEPEESDFALSRGSFPVRPAGGPG